MNEVSNWKIKKKKTLFQVVEVDLSHVTSRELSGRFVSWTRSTNPVTKRGTPLLDKDSVMGSKVYLCYKFFILETETSFVLNKILTLFTKDKAIDII